MYYVGKFVLSFVHCRIRLRFCHGRSDSGVSRVIANRSQRAFLHTVEAIVLFVLKHTETLPSRHEHSLDALKCPERTSSNTEARSLSPSVIASARGSGGSVSAQPFQDALLRVFASRGAVRAELGFLRVHPTPATHYIWT